MFSVKFSFTLNIQMHTKRARSTPCDCVSAGDHLYALSGSR